jgi:hypothetical protein
LKSLACQRGREAEEEADAEDAEMEKDKELDESGMSWN